MCNTLYFPNRPGNVKVLNDIVSMLKNCDVQHMINFFRSGGEEGQYRLHILNADEKMLQTCKELSDLQYAFENN